MLNTLWISLNGSARKLDRECQGHPRNGNGLLILQAELELHLGPGNVTAEEFTLAPEAFLGSLPLSAFFILMAVVLNISSGKIPGIPPLGKWLAALGFTLAALAVYLLEYNNYREFIDPLFRKKQSVNIIGSLCKPALKTPKRLLILSGHHDSAPENRWFRFLGYGFIVTLPTVLIGYVVMLVMSVLQLAGLISGSRRVAPRRNAGMGLAGLSNCACHTLCGIFQHGQEKRRNRSRRSR